jgi:hypothetical protein
MRILKLNEMTSVSMSSGNLTLLNERFFSSCTSQSTYRSDITTYDGYHSDAVKQSPDTALTVLTKKECRPRKLKQIRAQVRCKT